MSYRAELSTAAIRAFDALPPDVRLAVKSRIDGLGGGPRPSGSEGLKGTRKGLAKVRTARKEERMEVSWLVRARTALGRYPSLSKVFDDAWVRRNEDPEGQPLNAHPVLRWACHVDVPYAGRQLARLESAIASLEAAQRAGTVRGRVRSVLNSLRQPSPSFMSFAAEIRLASHLAAKRLELELSPRRPNGRRADMKVWQVGGPEAYVEVYAPFQAGWDWELRERFVAALDELASTVPTQRNYHVRLACAESVTFHDRIGDMPAIVQRVLAWLERAEPVLREETPIFDDGEVRVSAMPRKGGPLGPPRLVSAFALDPHGRGNLGARVEAAAREKQKKGQFSGGKRTIFAVDLTWAPALGTWCFEGGDVLHRRWPDTSAWRTPQGVACTLCFDFSSQQDEPHAIWGTPAPCPPVSVEDCPLRGLVCAECAMR